MQDREGFNFYRSYYETSMLLAGEDRLEFLDAIINYQFTGELIEPKRKLALLAFKGQIHSIRKQVIGYQKGIQTYPTGNPTKGKYKGKDKGSHKEVQVQVQEKEEEKGELNSINFSGLLKFINNTLGKNYQVLNDQLKNKYNARLKDGYTKEQIMCAIINASKDAYHVETKFKYLTPEFFSRSTIIDKYGFTSTKENEETKPDTLMDWEWEAMLRNREEVRKIQAYAAKEK